jgi:hypothetical protein
VLGRSRFVRADGKTAVLLLIEKSDTHFPNTTVWVYLFDGDGTLLDAVSVQSRGGASVPQAKFIIPVGGNGACVELSLLNWKNQPCSSVEIDHGEKEWINFPELPLGKLDQLKWTVFLRDGRLRVADAAGKTIAE